MKPFDTKELKGYIKFRSITAERHERQADRHGDENGAAFYAGFYYAYEDVLAQIERMEDEQ